jgi:hypothetical protein
LCGFWWGGFLHFLFVSLQLGHQASTCPNGTVNWKEKYGESAFRLRINQDPKDFRDPTDAEWAGMMKELKKKADEFTKV